MNEAYEFRISGESEWTPTTATSPRWQEVIEPALDLPLVTEVTFTINSGDSAIDIRYRKAEQ